MQDRIDQTRGKFEDNEKAARDAHHRAEWSKDDTIGYYVYMLINDQETGERYDRKFVAALVLLLCPMDYWAVWATNRLFHR